MVEVRRVEGEGRRRIREEACREIELAAKHVAEEVVVRREQRKELDPLEIERTVRQNADVRSEERAEDGVGKARRLPAGDVCLQVAVGVRGRTWAASGGRIVAA